jgi:hypothetical protein
VQIRGLKQYVKLDRNFGSDPELGGRTDDDSARLEGLSEESAYQDFRTSFVYYSTCFHLNSDALCLQWDAGQQQSEDPHRVSMETRDLAQSIT